MDRRGFLARVARGGLGAAGLAAPGAGFVAGGVRTSRDLQGTLAARVAASGARGRAEIWWSADTEDRAVALTFDDGPTEDLTPRVLDVLDRYRVPASFFVIGALAEQRPELVQRAHEAGHEIGNHTYHHVSAEQLDRDDVLATVEQGADAVAAVLGDRPRWFRPVKGHVTGAVLRAASRVGHDLAIWSLSRGPRSMGDEDSAAVRDHLAGAVHPGAIALLHDGIGRSSLDPFGPSDRLRRRREAELAALPEVVERWLAAGFRLVTLSDLVDHHHRAAPAAPPADADTAPEPAAVDAEVVRATLG